MAITDHEMRELVSQLPDDTLAEARLSRLIETADSRTRVAPSRTRVPRRLLGVGVSAIATLLVICGIAVVGSQTRSHDRDAPVGARTISAPGPSLPVAGDTTLTPQVMAQYLMDLLPKRGSYRNLSGTTNGTNVYASMQVDDGRGLIALNVVALLWNGPEGPLASRVNELSSCKNMESTVVLLCTTTSNGSELSAVRSDAGGVGSIDYRLIRPDGFQINISQYNAASPPRPGSVSTQSTQAELPFTTDEMITALSDTRWQRSVPASVAADAEHLFTPRPDPSTITGTAVLPDVRGMQAGDAIRALATAGFRNVENTLATGTGLTNGQVLTMSPTPGVPVDVSTKIVMTTAGP